MKRVSQNARWLETPWAHRAIIFSMALLLRIAYMLAVPPRPMEWDDSAQWNRTAMRFYQGDGVLENAQDLDPKRAPVYPAFMAAIYKVWGPENFTAVKHAQATVSALTCVAVYEVMRAVAAPHWALATGLALALYPPSIVYSEILQSETVYMLFFFLFLLLWLQGARSDRWALFIGAGIALGLTNLCRGTLLFLPFLIWPFELLYAEGRRRFPKVLAMGLVSFAVVAPWSVRNYKLYGGFLPVAAGGSEMLWYGTLPWEEQRLFGLAPGFQAFSEIKNPIELERTFSQAAKENISKDVGGYVKLTFRKFFFFWFQPVGERLVARRSPALGTAVSTVHAALIVLALFGILKTLGRWRRFLPFDLVIFYFAALHTLLAPEPRYRLPIEPLLIAFALGAFRYFRTAPDEK